MSSNTSPKTIVVIGGGAGALVARQLSALLDPATHTLILITARPHFQHYIGSIRAAVTSQGGFDAQVLMPLDRLLVSGNGKIITAEVTAFSEDGDAGGTVMLSNGDSVRWDALVLATGSMWEGPLDIPKSGKKALEWFRDWQERFGEAEDVLLVGGGSVAVEYAGEIKDLDPSKNVTIVHRDTMLLNKAYPDKFRKDVERRLRARGVDLLLGDTVSEDAFTGAKKITTRNGTALTPDLVIPCRGPRPNTSIISAALGADALTPTGHVKVLNTFQLPDHPRIFACGDIADLNEQRQIGKYGRHADVVSKNVLALLDGHEPSAVYKGSVEMIFITIGKYGGAGYVDFLWGICFGDWVVSMAKSRSLLVSKVRGFLGF